MSLLECPLSPNIDSGVFFIWFFLCSVGLYFPFVFRYSSHHLMLHDCEWCRLPVRAILPFLRVYYFPLNVVLVVFSKSFWECVKVFCLLERVNNYFCIFLCDITLHLMFFVSITLQQYLLFFLLFGLLLNLWRNPIKE